MNTAPLRRPTAGSRAALARRSLSRCTLCAHRCAVDRTAGPAGACRSDSTSRVFHEAIEWAGEEPLVPTYVVSLSGCNMTCSFCLTGGPSQNGNAGSPLDPDATTARIHRASPSLRSVTILGGEPSIHLDGALEIAARIPPSLPLVWKTNAYASPEGLALLEGIPDLVLADYKFGDDGCARRLANVPRYTEVVRENLKWAARTSRLMVRHLVMPGHLDCCLAGVVDWMARELPDTRLSLMTGYLPVFRAASDPVLGRTTRTAERRRAVEIAESRGVPGVPWVLAPGPAPAPCPADDVWIDREGRICVDSASPRLIEVLKRLNGEFVLTQ